MRFVTRALLVALVAAMTLSSSVAAAALPSLAVAYAPAAAVTDADDLIPYVEEVRAALTVLGAPTITELEILDNAPLADWYEEGARYVAAPSGDMGQVTMTILSWIVEDGTDEHAEFLEAIESLKAYGPTRGGATEVTPAATADAFGANEAIDYVVVGASGGQPKNILLGRLARFGKAIAYVSTDVDLTKPEVSDGDKMGVALINTILAKLVADKAK
jgi:hypothetical protein